MKKLILLGRSESGKSTLIQALRREKLHYQKTQYVDFTDWVIDTPGEYAEDKMLGGALAIYSYEADVVGLVISATEPYSLFSPNITCMTEKEVIGIITQKDKENAKPENAEKWLRLAGCKKIFTVNSLTGEGIDELKAYLGWI